MDNTNVTHSKILRQGKCIQQYLFGGSQLAWYMFCLEPEIGDLFEFVVPKVKAHWDDVAYTALRFDIPTVDGIQKKHQNDVKKCCQELFKIWLTTAHGVKPKTWSTLITRLKKVEELMSATEVIENNLKDLIL